MCLKISHLFYLFTFDDAVRCQCYLAPSIGSDVICSTVPIFSGRYLGKHSAY